MPILDAVTVGPLAAAGTYTYTFPAKLTKPDMVLPITNTTISVTAMTTTSVTFENVGSSSATATFILTWYYNEASRDNTYQSLELGWDGANGGGGGLTIGDAVSGGTTTEFLYVDSSGNLADSPNLTQGDYSGTPWIGIGPSPSQNLQALAELVVRQENFGGGILLTGVDGLTNTIFYIEHEDAGPIYKRAKFGVTATGTPTFYIDYNDANITRFRLRSGNTDYIDLSSSPYPITDAFLDLGASGNRWRNLYLSGGVVGASAQLTTEDTATNTTTDILTISHTTSQTPAAAFGAGVLFKLEDSVNNPESAMRIETVWNDPTNASEDSQLRVHLQNGGVFAENLRLGAGSLAFTLPTGVTTATVTTITTNTSAGLTGRRNAADTGTDVVLASNAARSAGYLAAVNNQSTRKWAVGWDARVYAGVPTTAPTDANLQNSEISWWLDEAVPAVMARIRKSDGTYLTLTIANGVSPTLA